MKKITNDVIGEACILTILKPYRWIGGEPLTVVILDRTKDGLAVVCENGAPENQYVVNPRWLEIIKL